MCINVFFMIVYLYKVAMYMSIQLFKSLYSDCSEDVLAFVEECFLDFYDRDKKNADRWMLALCELKINHPEFKIELSSSADISHYSYFDNRIIISSKRFVYDKVLFHEIAHALYFNKYGHKEPKIFERIIQNLRMDKDKIYDIISLVPFCRNHLLELNLKLSNNGDVRPTNCMKKYGCLVALEDIIDSILRGTAHDDGVTICKDDNYNASKLGVFVGHGSEYFSMDNSSFHEILAQYFAIAALDKEFLELVNSVLGEEMVGMLNGLYEDLIPCLKKDDIKSPHNENIKK